MSDVNQKNIDQVNEHLKKDTNLVKPVADLEKKTVRWVECEYGPTDEGDYVWHFSDHHGQRTFPPGKAQLFAEIIVTFLSKVIPEEFKVDYYPSPDGWEKSVITVKARGIAKEWNFEHLHKENMTKYIDEIANRMSDEIEKSKTKRKFV